jgi:chemotaxis methyl-accepting protein methylase
MGAQGTPDVLNTQPELSSRRSGLSARDFQLFQRLIHREAGIHLVESKRVLVEGRLSRRLRELGLDFSAYYALLETDEAERVRLVDAISTNETHFFREPRQFEFLESRVFPEWLARGEQGQMSRRVRVWSAACSTGEEPYSVAMSFLAHFPPGWEIEILASDLSHEEARQRAYLEYRQHNVTSNTQPQIVGPADNKWHGKPARGWLDR